MTSSQREKTLSKISVETQKTPDNNPGEKNYAAVTTMPYLSYILQSRCHKNSMVQVQRQAFNETKRKVQMGLLTTQPANT